MNLSSFCFQPLFPVSIRFDSFFSLVIVGHFIGLIHLTIFSVEREFNYLVECFANLSFVLSSRKKTIRNELKKREKIYTFFFFVKLPSQQNSHKLIWLKSLSLLMISQRVCLCVCVSVHCPPLSTTIIYVIITIDSVPLAFFFAFQKCIIMYALHTHIHASNIPIKCHMFTVHK